MIQRELLALVNTLGHFRKHINRHEFHLCTDHCALIWTFSETWKDR